MFECVCVCDLNKEVYEENLYYIFIFGLQTAGTDRISINQSTTNQLGRSLLDQWKVAVVGHDEKSSDHNYVTFRSTGISKLSKPSFKDVSKTDWDVYKAKLTENIAKSAEAFDDIDTTDELDTAAVCRSHPGCLQLLNGTYVCFV